MSQIKTILADLNEKLAKAEAGVAAWQEDANRIKAAIALISSYNTEPKKEKPSKAVKAKPVAKKAATKPAAKKAEAKKPEAKKEEKTRAPHAKKLPVIRQADWVTALATVSAETGSAGPSAIAMEVARTHGITDPNQLKLMKGRISPALAILVDQKKVKRVGEGQYALA